MLMVTSRTRLTRIDTRAKVVTLAVLNATVKDAAGTALSGDDSDDIMMRLT